MLVLFAPAPPKVTLHPSVQAPLACLLLFVGFVAISNPALLATLLPQDTPAGGSVPTGSAAELHADAGAR